MENPNEHELVPLREISPNSEELSIQQAENVVTPTTEMNPESANAQETLIQIDKNDESSKNDLENNLSSAVMDNTLFASGIEDKRIEETEGSYCQYTVSTWD